MLGAEEEYTSKIKDQMEVIQRLTAQVTEAKGRAGVLLDELNQGRESIARLEREVQELGALQRNMLTTINTLEVEREVYLKDISKLQYKLGQLKASWRTSGETTETWVQTDNIGQHQACVKTKEITQPRHSVTTGKKPAKKRLLILCDQTGCGLRNRLVAHLPGYLIQSIIKPNADYEGVIDDVVNLSKDFGQDDCILIMAGVNNFINGRYPSFREINTRLKRITHTNVVLTSILPLVDSASRNKNRFIRKYNEVMNQYAARLDWYACGSVSFLDMSSLSMEAATSKLAGRILSGGKIGSRNLIFIETTDSVLLNSGTSLCVTKQLVGTNIAAALDGPQLSDDQQCVTRSGNQEHAMLIGVGENVATCSSGENGGMASLSFPDKVHAGCNFLEQIGEAMESQ